MAQGKESPAEPAETAFCAYGNPDCVGFKVTQAIGVDKIRVYLRIEHGSFRL